MSELAVQFAWKIDLCKMDEDIGEKKLRDKKEKDIFLLEHLLSDFQIFKHMEKDVVIWISSLIVYSDVFYDGKAKIFLTG